MHNLSVRSGSLRQVLNNLQLDSHWKYILPLHYHLITVWYPPIVDQDTRLDLVTSPSLAQSQSPAGGLQHIRFSRTVPATLQQRSQQLVATLSGHTRDLRVGVSKNYTILSKINGRLLEALPQLYNPASCTLCPYNIATYG